MLTIRLSRVGKKKAPQYRIVIMEKARDPWAKSLEILGHYNPRSTPKTIVLKADRINYWISQGAEVSDTVWNLLVTEKIVEGKKRTASTISKKRTGKLSDKAEEAKVKAEEAKAKAEEEKVKAEADKVAAKEAAKAEAEKTEEVKEEKAEETTTPAEETPAEEEKSGEAGSGSAGKEETPAETPTKK